MNLNKLEKIPLSFSTDRSEQKAFLGTFTKLSLQGQYYYTAIQDKAGKRSIIC